jgi:hypothetical protein
MAIEGLVTRTSWDGKTWSANQKISMHDAAYNSGEEKIKGSNRWEAG